MATPRIQFQQQRTPANASNICGDARLIIAAKIQQITKRTEQTYEAEPKSNQRKLRKKMIKETKKIAELKRPRRNKAFWDLVKYIRKGKFQVTKKARKPKGKDLEKGIKDSEGRLITDLDKIPGVFMDHLRKQQTCESSRQSQEEHWIELQ